ncbi:holo-[acyl-carrier-protein] synthase, partial [bacterium B17]
MPSGRILGTGIDMVDNARVRDMTVKWGAKFKDKVFLPEEQVYCEQKAAPYQHYAGRFAVKEAVSKAVGTGFGSHIGMLDIEVIKDPMSGAPSVKLSEKARKLLSDCGADD